MLVKPKQANYISKRFIYTKSVGFLHHSSHTQASHGLSSQDKQCETHTEYDIFTASHKSATEGYHTPMWCSHLLFLTRGLAFQPHAEVRIRVSKSASVNTNQYIYRSPDLTTGR